MRLVDDPNERERHEPGRCGGCGANRADARKAAMEWRVFDVPPMPVRVAERRLIAGRCARGAVTRGRAPEGCDGAVRYGARITAIIRDRYVGRLLPTKRTAQAPTVLFGTLSTTAPWPP